MNTFGVNAIARYLVSARSTAGIREAFAWAKQKGLRAIALGRGSNVLFIGDIEGLVVHIASRGLVVSHKSETRAIVQVSAGEPWQGIVDWACKNGYGGIENLSCIPGSAGGAAVQNIGAYGVEFHDICHSVIAINRTTGRTKEFSPKECEFGYRSSIFKTDAENWTVTGIRMILDKSAPLRTDYGAIKETLLSRGIQKPGYSEVAEAVAAIRENKLPSPDSLGNAGSFFKNPVVPEAFAMTLKEKYPDVPCYRHKDGVTKLSAAWLLDQAGWRGKREGHTGCYAKQPVIVVNHGFATGEELLRFSRAIEKDILERFGIRLEREVVVYP